MITDTFFINLEKFARENNFDEGHGYSHFIAVYNHAKKAITAEDEEFDKETERMILLASLLHDVDDCKFFEDPDKTNYANARKLLLTENLSKKEIETIIQMISLVSCSKNGNSKQIGLPDWMFIPRWCDRLESSGQIGIERLLSYGKYVNREMFDNTTPRATTIEELNKIATVERFNNYLNKKLHDKTTIGHIYDKVLHITNVNLMRTTNTYIIREAEKRHQIIIDYVLDFWKNN